MNINEEQTLITLRKRHLIVKQNICKLFGKHYGLHLHCPLWKPVHVSANVMIFSLRISDICRLLTPYSADKLVPFSSFSICKITACLSFIKRTDRLRFKDIRIVNNHSWRSVGCLLNKPIECEISLSNEATLSQSELIRKFCISYDVCERCFILLFESETNLPLLHFSTLKF